MNIVDRAARLRWSRTTERTGRGTATSQPAKSLFSALVAAVFLVAFSAAGTPVSPAELVRGRDAVFVDKGLMPSGIDDFHCAIWTWPGSLNGIFDAAQEVHGFPEGHREFMRDFDDEIAVSFHWIWAARRMYDPVGMDSDAGRKALAEWNAAKEPPLLYYHIDRRTGDGSWTPIDFALSRDGRWMLCKEEGAGPDVWKSLRLLAIPEWRQTRVRRLFFELPDKKAELVPLRATVFCGRVDNGGEWGDEAVERQFADCPYASLGMIVGKFSSAPIPNRRDVETTLSLYGRNGDLLFSRTPETDVVHWEGRFPYDKKVEDLFEHVLPFAIHEVRHPAFIEAFRAGEAGGEGRGANGLE